MTDEELLKQARVLIDYTDPEVIARQNIPPNAGCVIDGTFYDVRNLVHLASSQADQIEALEQQVADLLANVPCACGYDSPTDVCMKHLPLVRNLTARAEKAEAALKEAEELLSRVQSLLTNGKVTNNSGIQVFRHGTDYCAVDLLAQRITTTLAKQGDQP